MTRKRNIMNFVFICMILLSVVSVRGQFVERKAIQRGNETPSVSLNEQEIAEEVNNAFRSAFLENQGQLANEEIIFYGSLPNGKIGFGIGKIMLWIEGMKSIVSLNYVGARKVSPIGINKLETKNNFFLGNRGTFTNVRSYGAILYEDLWKGIDLCYQATPMGAKYEFRVAPGANPEDIRIKCEGHEQLIIGKDSLTILKGNGRFVDEGLKVLQEGKEIDAKFVAKGRNAFGFQINKYDEYRSLVIDPLLYSTFVGGSSMGSGYSITLDNEGNSYVTGSTWSSDFPTTVDAYNRTFGGYNDCFVFKLSADGSSLLYSTFVGSGIGGSIALDSERNAYVTGNTASSDFPTTENAYNSTLSGGRDCFVSKISADGSSLLYSTFAGGSDYDGGESIVLDNEGNAYVTGNTRSSDFPTTENAYNRTLSGNFDCLIFKLSADGSSLLYSSYIGGSAMDIGCSIALDSEGNAYVTGCVFSSDFPTTENAYNSTLSGGRDCFVFKLSADGSSLLYSTFVGGNNDDEGYSIALDEGGNAHVTGYTRSSDFPTTENAYNRIHSGHDNPDCFVFELSSNGSSLIYSTFVGSSDMTTHIVLDNEGNAYVTGGTFSSDFPTTENAYNSILSGDKDCFVFKLSADGSSLLYSTFVGGSDHDSGYSIALDGEGNVHVTGLTMSSDFPTTENAYNRTIGGIDDYCDCFVFKLSIEDASSPTPIGGSKYWIIFPLGFVYMTTFVVYRKKKIR